MCLNHVHVPRAEVVASTFGPVCGTATESVGLRRQDEVEGAPLCDRAPRDGLCIPAEQSWSAVGALALAVNTENSVRAGSNTGNLRLYHFGGTSVFTGV